MPDVEQAVSACNSSRARETGASWESQMRPDTARSIVGEMQASDRIAPVAHQVAQFEVELAQRLAESECPVATLEPRVGPRV